MPRNLGLGWAEHQRNWKGSIGGIPITVAPAAMTPQQAYIVQKFQSQVYIQDQMDVQDEPIYDTIAFLTGQTINETTASWFSSVGDGAPLFLTSAVNKTLANTNMTKDNTLIAPEAQAIMQYRIQFNENIDPRDILSMTGCNIAAALGTLPTGFAYRFRMGTKDYQTGFVTNYAAGAGIYFTGTVDSQSFLQNGQPCAPCAQSLSVNLVIENEESFKANLIGNPYVVLGATGVVMKNSLMGLHARPIR